MADTTPRREPVPLPPPNAPMPEVMRPRIPVPMPSVPPQAMPSTPMPAIVAQPQDERNPDWEPRLEAILRRVFEPLFERLIATAGGPMGYQPSPQGRVSIGDMVRRERDRALNLLSMTNPFQQLTQMGGNAARNAGQKLTQVSRGYLDYLKTPNIPSSPTMGVAAFGARAGVVAGGALSAAGAVLGVVSLSYETMRAIENMGKTTLREAFARLSYASPSVAAIEQRMRLRQWQFDNDRGQRLTPGLDRLEKSTAQLQAQFHDFDVWMEDTWNYVKTMFVDSAADLMKFIRARMGVKPAEVPNPGNLLDFLQADLRLRDAVRGFMDRRQQQPPNVPPPFNNGGNR